MASDVRERWHATQDDLERAMRRRDEAAVDAALAAAVALQREAPVWSDYVDWLLYVAAEYGDLRAMRGLLAAGADRNNPNAEAGPPVVAAIRHGRVDAVRLLVEAGADLDVMAVRREGFPPPLTPLMEAVDTDRVPARRRPPVALRCELATVLLEGGASVNAAAPDWTDVEPLAGAPDDETLADYRFVLRVREAGGGHVWLGFDNAITAIALTSEAEVVRLLLDAGADPDLEPRGLALFRAIRDGRPDTVRMLLERGAQTTGVSPGRRRSPLREALDSGTRAVVEALLEHGAELHGGEE
jgi:hypothetical protein